MTPSEWFNGIIDRLLSMVVLPVFTGLVIIMFIWAGVLFLTAHGDPTKITSAKKAVLWAIVGIVVVLLSTTAVSFIKKIIGAPPT